MLSRDYYCLTFFVKKLDREIIQSDYKILNVFSILCGNLYFELHLDGWTDAKCVYSRYNFRPEAE